MGSLHARTVTSCPETRLVAVHDHHPERAASLAAAMGCDVGLAEASLYIVATPAHTHVTVGAPLLERAHVLFEKPAGIGWDDRLAHPRALVAFSERYHRGFRGIRVRTRFEAVRERQSRAEDVDALDDLLIHDLDLLSTHTVGARLEAVARSGTAVEARFVFHGGTATLRVDGSTRGRVEHQVDGVRVERSHTPPDPLTRQLRAVLDQLRTDRGTHGAAQVRRYKRWIEEIRCGLS